VPQPANGSTSQLASQLGKHALCREGDRSSSPPTKRPQPQCGKGSIASFHALVAVAHYLSPPTLPHQLSITPDGRKLTEVCTGSVCTSLAELVTWMGGGEAARAQMRATLMYLLHFCWIECGRGPGEFITVYGRLREAVLAGDRHRIKQVLATNWFINAL
jgi:hypothetical protein